MAKVDYYHSKEEADSKYHWYDDCPAGERVIKDGNKEDGTGGSDHEACKFCTNKDNTGKFSDT